MTLYSPGGLNLADTTAPLILAFDDTGTTDVVFAVSASGDLTITPDGGDVTVTGTLHVTGNVGIGQAPDAGRALAVLEATTGEAVASLNHTHATGPNGLLVIMSGGAPNDTTQYFLQMNDSAGLQAVIYSDGAYQGSANSYGALSDRRLKTNIEAMESNWSQYKRLKWSIFNKEGDDQKGLIAQDVLQIFPDHVYEDGQTGIYGLNYMGIATETGRTVHECQIRIEALEDEIRELKAA